MRLRRQLRQMRTERRDRHPYDYLFVMTYGRSGSTLLQAILNATPGVLVRGENRALTYHLHAFHQSALQDAERGAGGRGKGSPWFGIQDYPSELALERMRSLVLDTVLRPRPNTRVTGFKEIRWYQDDLPEYLEFMQQLFPGARFILNTRNLDDVARSDWWRTTPGARARLQDIEDRMMAAAAPLGTAVYHLGYDEYVHDPRRLRDMYDWLDLPFDEARVREVMQRGYSRPSST